MPTLKTITDDITTLEIDAIVNAANTSLLGGGGVDGAIHRAAGPQLLAYCRGLNGCATGEARITPGFDLPAEYVIHTVGPVWQGGQHNEAQLLRACYTNSLNLAAAHHLQRMAFPAISTGVYGYPKAQACQIAVDTVRNWTLAYPQEVLFVCFDPETLDLYQALLA